jgi:hypothetical protein
MCDSPQAYDRNKSQFIDVAVKVMQDTLTLMCPITYSAGNLGSLVERGKRVQNKSTLMRIIERNTGISGEDTIEPTRRCDRMVVEDILKAYNEKGSRGKDLQLPPNYEKDGPFEIISIVGNECTVTNKFESTIAKTIIPRHAELYVDLPWSESRAVLRQKNGEYRKSMAQIFLESITPPVEAPKPSSHGGGKQPTLTRRPAMKAPSPGPSPPPTPRSWEKSPDPSPYPCPSDQSSEDSQDIYDTLDREFFGGIRLMEGCLIFIRIHS